MAQDPADTAAGMKALRYFYDASSPEPYPSYDDMINAIEAKNPDAVDGLGFGINVGGVSGPLPDSKVQAAMQALAAQANGQMPANYNDFFAYLQDQAKQVSFTAAIVATAEGTAADLGTGLQKVGNTAITTLNNTAGLVTLLPYVGFAALVFYIYLATKRRAA